MLTVASPPIITYQSSNFLLDTSNQVSKLLYIEIVEYLVMDLFTFIAVAREGLIVDGRSGDGSFGSGGKLIPFTPLVRRLVNLLGFLDII